MKTTREIKFRGKRIDNGEWVYGNYFNSTDEWSGIVHIIRQYSKDKRGYKDYRVNPKTVGQFTGLKDRNGKEVYEGDYVQRVGECFEVKWNQLHCQWSLFQNGLMKEELCADWVNPDGTAPDQWKASTLTIIKNRFKNPELLTQTQDDN